MPECPHYNDCMEAAATERLLQINQRFYAEHGHDFSETRQRLQPGVRRLIETLHGDEAVLDLGCGNGELARALSVRGHRGPYVGVDFSPSLLDAARAEPGAMPTRFVRADLLGLSAQQRPEWSIPPAASPMPSDQWDVITAFAVLHHVPGRTHRLELLRTARSWLGSDGRFFLSNWQFLNSERMRARVQPWAGADLTEAEVDPGDFLLDWRHGSPGLRYVHQFDEAELRELAAASGFVQVESFYSDGADHRSGLYQVWIPLP